MQVTYRIQQSIDGSKWGMLSVRPLDYDDALVLLKRYAVAYPHMHFRVVKMIVTDSKLHVVTTVGPNNDSTKGKDN